MPTTERGKSQRSHQDMTLLLLLVLSAGLAAQVHSESDDTTGEEPIAVADPVTVLNAGEDDVTPTKDTASTTLPSPEENGLSGEGELDAPEIIAGPTDAPGQGENVISTALNPLVIIIPLVLLLLLIVALSVAAFILSRRRLKKHSGPVDMREDEFLHGCETEKVPMPMFEDDVPSVLELEMEDLEKWMIKDTGRICMDSTGDEG